MDTIEKMKKQRRNAALIAICIGLVIFLIIAMMIGFTVHSYLTTDYTCDINAINESLICNGKIGYCQFGCYITNHSVKCQKAGGGWTVAEYTIQDESGEFMIESSLESGEMRLYLVKNNAEIVKEIPINQKVSYPYSAEGKTEYSLRVLCSNAENIKVSMIKNEK